MRLNECSLIQELLPLYAEKLVSTETAAYIEEHLATCASCAREWDNFTMPLPDPAAVESISARHVDRKIMGRLRKTAAAIAFCILLGGAGLAYASFAAGRHVGMDDPVYRFAQELDLFTEIEQTKKLGEVQVTLTKGLFDSTRSVLFLSFGEKIDTIPQVNLTGNTGVQYEERGAKGWNNKYFMLEFEPIELDTEELKLTLFLGEGERQAEFSFPVDALKTAQYTKIIYPNQKVELDELKINLEKVILGVSETECKVRLDWPVEGKVAAVGFGRNGSYFPTSVRKASELPASSAGETLAPGGLLPGYAASFQEFYHADNFSFDKPALYDLTERKEVEADSAEYATTQFPCQLEAILNFAPVSQESQQLELLLPSIYLYSKVDAAELNLNFREKGEIDLGKSIPLTQGELVLGKAWLKDGILYLSYSLENVPDGENILPHFQLTDATGQKLGQMGFDRENSQVILFHLFEEERVDFNLKLDSIGKLLPRHKFVLELQ